MGWNSWNCFGKTVSEDAIKGTAQALVASGMAEAGYEYVVIDDHWHGGRSADGRLFSHPERFPSGIPSLADHVHGLGLKLGIYSDAAEKTCGGEVGSLGFEDIDARTFAEWGVDYLKYDYCHAPSNRAAAIARYSAMGRALQASGRPIVFSLCEWGGRNPWEWGRSAGGHLWRTTGDVWDGWRNGQKPEHRGIDHIGFDLQRGLEAYAGPGGWNDPDMLVVGLYGQGSIAGPGCTDTEYRTQFSLWCLLAAPLMAGCDLRRMNEVTRTILTNREVIALNQDPLGLQGRCVGRHVFGEVWLKPLQFGHSAVGLFNRGEEPLSLTAHWSNLGLHGPQQARNLWTHQDLGVFTEEFSAEVEPHGCVLLRLAPA
jgi:alpha-galactosidase